MPDGNVVLTPSSLDYRTMALDDLVVCDLEGEVRRGTPQPDDGEDAPPLGPAPLSRDQRDHALPRQALHDVRAARRPIPAVIEEFVVYVGGDVPVAGYKTTGTDELADEVARHVGDRSAVLMANHGLFAVGKNAADVLHVARAGGAHRRDRVGRDACSARSCRCPRPPSSTFAGYYRFGRTG